ncbi:MAG: tripartite tricarboxylate transporter substrate binding protein [Rhizobiales bacterium]|nr:tripartite tricarboxylate transporter substrate binding protein [Hyphomicrobiales bacterium]
MLRQIMSLALTAGLVVGGFSAAAQDYPNRPIRFVQGFAPGGNADVITRILGEEMSKSLGQPIVSEARPGAGGNLASEQVVRMTPDGYTMVLLTTAHVISPALYKSLNFDPVKDFQFLSTVTDLPFFFVANSESRFKSIKDVVDEARAKPGTVTVGTAGVGTGQHMCTELFASATGSKVVHVPFRGDSGAVTALLGKNVDVIVAPGTAILGNIQGGKFKALAISGTERWPPLPDVPTVAETVAPGFEMMAWVGVGTTARVPRPIVDRLNAELRKAIAAPNVDKRLRDLGGFPKSSTPEEMKTKVETHIRNWTDLANKAGIPKR